MGKKCPNYLRNITSEIIRSFIRLLLFLSPCFFSSIQTFIRQINFHLSLCIFWFSVSICTMMYPIYFSLLSSHTMDVHFLLLLFVSSFFIVVRSSLVSRIVCLLRKRDRKHWIIMYTKLSSVIKFVGFHRIVLLACEPQMKATHFPRKTE